MLALLLLPYKTDEKLGEEQSYPRYIEHSPQNLPSSQSLQDVYPGTKTPPPQHSSFSFSFHPIPLSLPSFLLSSLKEPRLASLCSQGWPWTSETPVSVSTELELPVSPTALGFTWCWEWSPQLCAYLTSALPTELHLQTHSLRFYLRDEVLNDN